MGNTVRLEEGINEAVEDYVKKNWVEYPSKRNFVNRVVRDALLTKGVEVGGNKKNQEAK